MKIEDFIKQYVDGYLLHDLESMSKVTVPAGSDGAVGYPMMVTTLAGMELLGYLLMPSTRAFSKNGGEGYFLHYWNKYFSVYYPAYTSLGRLFRQLIRHGVAHTFVGKPGIFIEKDKARHQVSLDTTRKELYVDAVVFYEEFKDSYERGVKPILDGTSPSPQTTITIMQSRLDSMINSALQDTNDEFALLTSFNPALNLITPKMANGSSYTLPTRSSGASGYPASISQSGMALTSTTITPSGIKIKP